MRTVALAIAWEKQARCRLVWHRNGYDSERCQDLHCISKADATIFTFERAKDFNLKHIDDDGRFGYSDGSKVKLSFRIKKATG